MLAFCRRWVPIPAPRRVTESCSRSKVPLDLFAPPALELHDWLERRENIGGPGQLLWPAVQSLDAAVAHLVTIAQIPAFVDFIRGTDSSKSTCSISFISPRTKIWLGDELGATGA